MKAESGEKFVLREVFFFEDISQLQVHPSLEKVFFFFFGPLALSQLGTNEKKVDVEKENKGCSRI